MRSFGTTGRVRPEQHYVVPRTEEIADFIDEFDGIPQTVVSDFLYSLRQVYLSDEMHCPHSVGIVGVKSIAQLDYVIHTLMNLRLMELLRKTRMACVKLRIRFIKENCDRGYPRRTTYGNISKK